VSAAKAEILQRIHRPVWKDHSLVSKTTWVGTLDSMQYYATVSAGKTDFIDGIIEYIYKKKMFTLIKLINMLIFL
jgi:hypothetical protein